MAKYVDKVEGETSVKKIGVIEKPTLVDYGSADFTNMPVFSVFDIGTIKPPVPLDNSTICLMGGFNFEVLDEVGIDTHYVGLVDDNGRVITARNAIRRGVAPTTTRVMYVNRDLPVHTEKGWDYSLFRDHRTNNRVHPIEFISRNTLPKSSSVWKRIKDKEITLADLGLPPDLKKGDPVPDELMPLLDYSTKFEPHDRYISPAVARELLGISQERFDAINETTRAVSNVMTDYAESRGFKRLDGKIEYITLFTRGFREDRQQADFVADAVCTWHEDRLVTPQGVGISKQRIRDEVEKLNPKWYADIQEAKKQAKTDGVADFRTLMDPSIEYTSPSPEFFHAINTLFRAGTNQWVDRKVYDVYSGQGNTLEGDLSRAVEDFQRIAR